MAKTQVTIYSVSQVNHMIAAAVEQHLPPRMVVSGQVTDFKVHSSGHCYFSLKDGASVLSCVMWASKFRTVKFRPENGMAVLATGSVEVYVQAGRVQFYVDKLDPAGVGALQLAFEQMKLKLQAEGLFDEEHKKLLPEYPMRIGVVTSASGAAIEDIRNSIFKRWPCAKLFLFDVPVQGEGAAAKIATAIGKANQMRNKLGLDVLIVGRGGGSMEDLWAFNEEPVARAIYDSLLPVVSAVGHEVDFTIADFVADIRASTPTQAGVLVVPDAADVLASLESMQKRIVQSVKGEIRHLKSELNLVISQAVFRAPLKMLLAFGQSLDEQAGRMETSIRKRMSTADRKIRDSEMMVARIEPIRIIYVGESRMNGMAGRLAQAMAAYLSREHRKMDKVAGAILKTEPNRLVLEQRMGLSSIENRLFGVLRSGLSKNQLQITAAENRLHALNPRAVLDRGYSITHNRRTGSVVMSAGDVSVGDVILTELARKNSIQSVVQEMQSE